jgi:hypothetical protein
MASFSPHREGRAARSSYPTPMAISAMHKKKTKMAITNRSTVYAWKRSFLLARQARADRMC